MNLIFMYLSHENVCSNIINRIRIVLKNCLSMLHPRFTNLHLNILVNSEFNFYNYMKYFM
jgi:hypothetical protein